MTNSPNNPYGNVNDATDVDTSVELEPNTVLGNRFHILKKIGEGGMGVVYVAVDKSLLLPNNKVALTADNFHANKIPSQALIALKVLNPDIKVDEQLRTDFINEVNNARRLTDRHIIRVYEPHEMNGLLFFTMELLSGHNLFTELKANPGGLSVGKTKALLQPIAKALDYAHKEGVIHRDITPKNIFLHKNIASGVETTKLLDFGIAHFLTETVVTHGTREIKAKFSTTGTDPYMSPERFAGADANLKDDVYSFAAITYQTLTGQRPFYGGEM